MTLLFTHKKPFRCNDALGSMVALSQHTPNFKIVEVDYLNPGESLSSASLWAGKEVYILDFSFPPDLLEMISKQAKAVTMLDHHKTGFDLYLKHYRESYSIPDGARQFSLNLFGNTWVVLDLDRAAALMTWEHLLTTPAPDLIRYISDGDLYRFQLPGSRDFLTQLGQEERSIEHWTRLLALTPVETKSMIQQGVSVQRFAMELYALMGDESLPVEITSPVDGEVFRGRYVACPRVVRNQVGEAIYKKHGGFALMMTGMEDGLFSLSIRSDQLEETPCNVRMIAEQFGGGGHDSASGIKISPADFERYFRVTSDTNPPILLKGRPGPEKRGGVVP